MRNTKQTLIDKWMFRLALALIIYMPLHVFIVQSFSLATGGIEVWKAAKDVIVFLLSPGLLFISYKRGLFKDRTVQKILILGAVYATLHGAFLIFDQNDDTYSALVGSVYNTRLLVYLLIGYLVGSAKRGKRYLKYLFTAAVLISTVVAALGVAQYFLPHDLLTHVGYSMERGVKYMFFIDDKPNLPRIMSTLKDPNSLGAYLILPILAIGLALIKKAANKELFIRPFRRKTLVVMLALQLTALIMTFSRGAAIGLVAACLVVIMLNLVGRRRSLRLNKKLLLFLVIALTLTVVTVFKAKDSYLVQNVVFHADESTVAVSSNQLRVNFLKDAVQDISDTPTGHGPGTAGLVAISNPQGGRIIENYFLQVLYEVGWVGGAILVAMIVIIARSLFKIRENLTAVVLIGVLGAQIVICLLVLLWSNEAVASQLWILMGVSLGAGVIRKKTNGS